MALIESNNQLRTRVAELLGAQFHVGGSEANDKVNEELCEEHHKANMEIQRLQEAIESNPKLTEALVDAEEAEADRYKKLYQSACSERNHVIRKNDSLKQSLHDAKLTMGSVPASWSTVRSRVAARGAKPASSSSMPSMNPAPRATATTSMTPSFAVSISTPMGTPKASSTTKNYGPALLPLPSPSMNNAINNQANNEIDDLREKLRRAKEQAQQNYDEMKEY